MADMGMQAILIKPNEENRFVVLNVVYHNRSQENGARFPRAHAANPKKVQDLLARSAKDLGADWIKPEDFGEDVCLRISQAADDQARRNELIIEALRGVGVLIREN